MGNWQFGLHSSDHVRHQCGGGGHRYQHRSNIVDDNNINAAHKAGAGGDPLDDNGNDDAVVGRRKCGRQGSDLWSLYTDGR